MRTIFLFIAVLIVFANCKKEKGYTIEGEFAYQKNGVVLLQKNSDNGLIVIDSCLIDDGRFVFEGKVDVVEEYILTVSDRERKLFFLDNTSYKVKVDSVFAKAQISGGKVQSLYNTYLKTYDEKYDYMLTEYYRSREITELDERDRMEAYVDSLYSAIELYQEQFFYEHINSPVACYLLTRIQHGKTAAELNEMLQKLDPSLASMNAYQTLEKRINALLKVEVGQIAPDFLVDNEGRIVATNLRGDHLTAKLSELLN